MARTKRKTKASRGFRLPLWLILLIVVVAQAAYLALFIHRTGTWWPETRSPIQRAADSLTRNSRDEIDELKLEIQNLKQRLFMSSEEREDDRRVQNLLEKRGSRAEE